jgi:hypothetical protein
MATEVPTVGRGYKLRGQHVNPFSHCSIWLCYTASDLALAHKSKIWIKYMHYEKCIRQWKHKHKDAQLFVTRQLAQSGKQDKTFTCSLWYSLASGKRASVKLHLWKLKKSYYGNNTFSGSLIKTFLVQAHPKILTSANSTHKIVVLKLVFKPIISKFWHNVGCVTACSMLVGSCTWNRIVIIVYTAVKTTWHVKRTIKTENVTAHVFACYFTYEDSNCDI